MHSSSLGRAARSLPRPLHIARPHTFTKRTTVQHRDRDHTCRAFEDGISLVDVLGGILKPEIAALISSIIAVGSVGLNMYGRILAESKRAELQKDLEMERQAYVEQYELQSVMAKYRGPLLEATVDLEQRITHLITKTEECCLSQGINEEEIDYTLYTLAQFLGFLEVLRREGPRERSYLGSGNPQGTDTLATLMEGIRFVLCAYPTTLSQWAEEGDLREHPGYRERRAPPFAALVSQNGTPSDTPSPPAPHDSHPSASSPPDDVHPASSQAQSSSMHDQAASRNGHPSSHNGQRLASSQPPSRAAAKGQTLRPPVNPIREASPNRSSRSLRSTSATASISSTGSTSRTSSTSSTASMDSMDSISISSMDSISLSSMDAIASSTTTTITREGGTSVRGGGNGDGSSGGASSSGMGRQFGEGTCYMRVSRGAQRAIGSLMIKTPVGAKLHYTISYFEFHTRLKNDPVFTPWFEAMRGDILALLSVPRWRGQSVFPISPWTRLLLIQQVLMDTIDILDPEYFRFPESRRIWLSAIDYTPLPNAAEYKAKLMQLGRMMSQQGGGGNDVLMSQDFTQDYPTPPPPWMAGAPKAYQQGAAKAERLRSSLESRPVLSDW